MAEKVVQVSVGAAEPSTSRPAPPGHEVRRVVAAAVAGTFLEYYDFAIYGAMAGVLAQVMFAAEDPTTALLNTFAVFALAFFARPLFGFIWGRMGDRIGRKRVLVIIIAIMSVSTALMGVLPTYAAVGIAAPLLLIALRLAQGASAGGELAGAAVYIAEFAPDRRRSILTGTLQMTTSAATVIGLGFATLLSALLTPDQMLAYGWRIPFLLAAPLGLIGYYFRSRLHETPKFESVKERPRSHFTKHTAKEVARSGLILLSPVVTFYMVLTFMPSYLTRSLKFTAVGSLGVVCIGALVAIVCIPIMGWLSDKYGRRPINIGSAIATIVLVVPSFLLLQQGLGFAILGIVLLAVAIAGGLNVSQITGLERFPTSIRYTGYATALALCSALFGGTAPYISTFLVASTGNVIAPAFYVVAAAIVTLTVSALTNETAFKPLPE